MPYVITTTTFPTDKIDETAKMYTEVTKKYPPDENLGNILVQSAIKTTKKGINALTVMEVKEGKLEEALARTAAELSMYRNIVGYEYSVDVWQTVEEAFISVGMSAPE